MPRCAAHGSIWRKPMLRTGQFADMPGLHLDAVQIHSDDLGLDRNFDGLKPTMRQAADELVCDLAGFLVSLVFGERRCLGIAGGETLDLSAQLFELALGESPVDSLQTTLDLPAVALKNGVVSLSEA